MMTSELRLTPRSKLLAMTRLASCAVLALAVPASAWGQDDDTRRIFYLGVKAGEGSVPWEGSRWFEDKNTDVPMGVDGLWLTTGERRWGIGVAATYSRMAFDGALKERPWIGLLGGTEVEEWDYSGGSAADIAANALGVALVLGRSGRVWTVFGGVGYGIVSAEVDPRPATLPKWLAEEGLALSSQDYEDLVRGMAVYAARNRDPAVFANAFTRGRAGSFGGISFYDDFRAVANPDLQPDLPGYNGLYMVFGVLRGKPRGFNYGLTVESFSSGGWGSFSTANVTLGWKF